MYNYFSKEPTLHISMQYFADPEGGEGNDSSAEGGNDDGKAGSEEQQKDPTLKELLASNKTYQSEYDKMTAKAQETAVKNAREKWEAEQAEAAKLAKMNAEEKAAHEREKREKELSDREAAIVKRELHAEAVTQLTEKGLPAGLADILDLTSADNCKKSMEAVEKSFNEAVNKAVEGKLKGKAPQTGGGNQTGDSFLAGLGVN